MKKVILLLSILILSSCSNKDTEQEVDNTNTEIQIVEKKEIEQNNEYEREIDTIEFLDKKLKDLNCEQYTSEINIINCLEETNRKMYESNIEKKGKNECKNLFDSNLYNKEYGPLLNNFFNECNNIYKKVIKEEKSNKTKIKEKKVYKKPSIKDCNVYDDKKYDTYKDDITGLKMYNRCRLEYAFKDKKRCAIFEDQKEKKECEQIDSYIDNYKNSLNQKRYYEMFNDIY